MSEAETNGLYKTTVPSGPAIPCIGLNADDAARAIGVSKNTILEMARKGEIPHVRRGNKTQIFDPDDLRAWVLANKISAKG